MKLKPPRYNNPVGAQPESLISFAIGYNNFHPDRDWARFFFDFVRSL